MIQAKTVTLSRDTTPNTVQVRRGDIVAFHAANADVVLCFDHAAFFGAYRYALSRGTTLPLVVQGHAPLGATRYSVKFDDLTVECFPRSLVEGEIQISRLSVSQPAPPPEPQPAPPPEPPPPPSTLPPPERLVEIRFGDPPPPLNLNNLIPGEEVTFHAIDTDATVCIPEFVFGVAVIQIANGATSIQIVQEGATQGDFTYQIEFILTDECDRGEDEGGSVGGRD